MSDNPFEMTADVNGKPVPRWQLRLEGMYSDGVPFGEVLSLVRSLIDDSAVNHILNMSDEEILAATPDHAQFAAEMRQRFDVVARLIRGLQAATAWIEQLTTYTNPDPSAPGQQELVEQLRAALRT